LMNVEGLSRENVASHLQKYRSFLNRKDTDDCVPSFQKVLPVKILPTNPDLPQLPSDLPVDPTPTPAVNDVNEHVGVSTKRVDCTTAKFASGVNGINGIGGGSGHNSIGVVPISSETTVPRPQSQVGQQSSAGPQVPQVPQHQQQQQQPSYNINNHLYDQKTTAATKVMGYATTPDISGVASHDHHHHHEYSPNAYQQSSLAQMYPQHAMAPQSQMTRGYPMPTTTSSYMQATPQAHQPAQSITGAMEVSEQQQQISNSYLPSKSAADMNGGISYAPPVHGMSYAQNSMALQSLAAQGYETYAQYPSPHGHQVPSAYGDGSVYSPLGQRIGGYPTQAAYIYPMHAQGGEQIGSYQQGSHGTHSQYYNQMTSISNYQTHPQYQYQYQEQQPQSHLQQYQYMTSGGPSEVLSQSQQ